MGENLSGSGVMAQAIAERAGAWRAIEVGSGWPCNTTFAELLDLSSDYGETDLPPIVAATVEEALLKGETHYTDRPGLPALREAIERKLAREQNVKVDWHHEVVISCGRREGVFLALQVLVHPGDEVLAPDPGPVFMSESVRLARGTLVPVPLLPEEGFELKADRIRERLTPRSRVLVLVNPGEPTGAVIARDELERIAALAVEHDLTILADEALDESYGTHVSHTSIAALPGAAARTVIVGSFSSFFGLASWRVGYFAGPKSAVTAIRDMKQAMTICTSAMSQYAALAMLTHADDWLARRKSDLDAARGLVLAALEELGLPHSRPEASPYVFVDVRSTGRSAEEFAGWLRATVNVAVMPGSRYGAQGQGFIRISLWPDLSVLEQAMRRMQWALNQVPGGAR